jgi:hypothetical protein
MLLLLAVEVDDAAEFDVELAIVVVEIGAGVVEEPQMIPQIEARSF